LPVFFSQTGMSGLLPSQTGISDLLVVLLSDSSESSTEGCSFIGFNALSRKVIRHSSVLDDNIRQSFKELITLLGVMRKNRFDGF
jgi:hypothetical protein